MIRKEYDSDIKPCVGDYLNDSFWKDPYEYKVVCVTINYEDNSCYVELAEYNVPEVSFIKEHYDVAKLHGWTGE